MKVSVLVIAHNEKRYIEKCLDSIRFQSRRPDEVVVLVHNSTDYTAKKAEEKYRSANVIRYDSLEKGIVYARLEGLKHVTGDVILCLDGDSFAESNWVQEMSDAAVDENILVGSRVLFKGTVFGRVLNVANLFPILFGKKNAEWIWGQSFAFEARDKPSVIEAYRRSIGLTQLANLSRNPDDYWLALMLSREGCMEVINTTSVTCHTKEATDWQMMRRFWENRRNARLIQALLTTNASLVSIRAR